jgi:hypothetical protein
MGYSTFRPTGTVYHDPERAFDGFTLFSTMGGDRTYLVDMAGTVVHTWPVPDRSYRTFYGHLLPNGNLFMLYLTPKVAMLGGSGIAVELDWDGQVVWSYEDSSLHHDFCRRSNGNTLLICWGRLPTDVAGRIQGGRANTEPVQGMIGDVIREVDPQGSIVWEWPAHQALDPSVDILCPLHQRTEWTHCNSIDELPNGDILVSFRLIDTIAIVDRASGLFTFKWGPRQLGHPHDATVLPNGNVLVFDNGWHQYGVLDSSRVIEVEPATGNVLWQFSGSPSASFFAAHLGGAQRLPNGNTLICEGSTGRLFEVTPDRAIVWEYANPYTFPFREDIASPRISRARRYAANSPEIRDRCTSGEYRVPAREAYRCTDPSTASTIVGMSTELGHSSH